MERVRIGILSVFVVDDHELVRRGLLEVLGADPELEVIGQAGSVAEAVERITATNPDVAILDVRLPDGDGIALCRKLRTLMPGLRCVILTSYGSDEALADARQAGAGAFIVKDIKGVDLVQVVKDVGAGRSLLDANAVVRNRAKGPTVVPDPLATLTFQERALLSLLGEGLTNRQIADRMFLAEKTVKNYVSKLLAKLGMERRTQAAVFVTELKRNRPTSLI